MYLSRAASNSKPIKYFKLAKIERKISFLAIYSLSCPFNEFGGSEKTSNRFHLYTLYILRVFPILLNC